MSDSHSYIHLRNYWSEEYQGQAQDEEFTQSSKKADRNPCPYSHLLKGERDNKYNKYIQHAVRWKEVFREKVERGVGALHLKQCDWRKLCWKGDIWAKTWRRKKLVMQTLWTSFSPAGTARAEAKALSSLGAAVAGAQWYTEGGEETELRSESTAARPRVRRDQREDLGFYCETEGKLLRVQSRWAPHKLSVSC